MEEEIDDDFVLVEIDKQELQNADLEYPSIWASIYNTAGALNKFRCSVSESITKARNMYIVYYIGSTIYSYRYWIYGLASIIW